MYGNADNGSYMEYCVKKKLEGSYLLKRCLFFAGWTILPIALLLIGLSNVNFLPLAMLFPVWVIISASLAFFTYRFVSIEYEYAITSGSIMVDIIYGNRSRKKMVDFPIKEMECIAPYAEEYRKTADSPEIEKRYEAVSTLSAPDVYFCTFTDDKDRKCVLFIEATDRALSLMKPYNRKIVLRTK